MKKSKLLLTLVVVVLVCSMLFTLIACNNDKDKDKDNETQTEQNNKPKPKPQPKPEVDPDAESPESQAAIEAFGSALSSAVVLDEGTKKAGFDYAVKVRVADENNAAGVMSPAYLTILVKGALDVETTNNNKFELSASKQVGTDKATDVFSLLIDDKDVYFSNATSKRVFPGLNLGDVIVAQDALSSDGFAGILDMVTGVVGSMFFTNGKTTTVDAGTMYSVDLDLEGILNFAGDALPTLLKKSVPEIKYVAKTITALFADLGGLASNVVPTFSVIVDNANKVVGFNIDAVVSWEGEEKTNAHVEILPKVGADVVPAITLPTAEEKKAYVSSQLVNFSLNGQVKLNAADPKPTTYEYKINGDVDVFCVARNLLHGVDLVGMIKSKNFAGIEKIFDGTQTKLFVELNDVTDPATPDPMVRIAMDATDKDMGNAIYVADIASGMYQKIDYIAQIKAMTAPDPMTAAPEVAFTADAKDANKATASWTAVKGATYTALVNGSPVTPTTKDGVMSTPVVAGDSVEVSYKIPAAADKAEVVSHTTYEYYYTYAEPVLTVEEPTNDEYVAAMNKNGVAPGRVYFNTVFGAEYAVTVGDTPAKANEIHVVTAPTKDKEGKSYVNVESGQTVQVWIVKDGVEVSPTAFESYTDGRAVARVVAKVVSALTAIDFDYSTYSVVLKGFYLDEIADAYDRVNSSRNIFRGIAGMVGSGLAVNANGQYFDVVLDTVKADLLAGLEKNTAEPGQEAVLVPVTLKDFK